MAPLTTLFGDDADIVRSPNFQVLLLANLAGPLGPALMSPLLDSLTGPFGVPETRIGLVITFYFAPGIVLIPLAGVLADRYGRKPVLIAGLTLFGVTGSAIAFTTDFRVVLGLRFLQGIGAAGLVPIIITSIGDLYEGAEEAAAQGFRFAVSGVSQTVFPAIAGFLVVVAWQYPILIYALALPIAGVVYLRLDEPADSIRAGETGGGSQLRRLARLAVRPDVAAVLLARALPGFLYIGFLTYNSIVVVRVLGGTPAQAGLLVGLSSVVFAVASSQAGRVTAAFDGRLVPILAGNVCMGAGLGLVGMAPSVAVAGVGVAVLGAGFGLLMSLYRSLITGLAPESLRGGLVSLAEGLGKVGTTAAPVAIGAVVALAEPAAGFGPALRSAVLGTGVIGGGAGIALVLAATALSPD